MCGYELENLNKKNKDNLKKIMCLLEEQLFLYQIYTRRIDNSLFCEFEYTNNDISDSGYINIFYIKNFENGSKFLYGHNGRLAFTNNPINALQNIDNIEDHHKQFNFLNNTLRGDITIVYDLNNGYDVRYDYFGHMDKHITLCEIIDNLRICNKKNKIIYEFSEDFMRYHKEAMYTIDRSFIEEIIDFNEKSILKDDEEYHNAGINQLKKKEINIINKIKKLLIDHKNKNEKTPQDLMCNHLKQKKPADYYRAFSRWENQKLAIKCYESLEVNWISEKMFYNVTDDLSKIISIGMKIKSKKDEIQRMIEDFDNSANYTGEQALKELAEL